jgi:hypothetical protein
VRAHGSHMPRPGPEHPPSQAHMEVVHDTRHMLADVNWKVEMGRVGYREVGS